MESSKVKEYKSQMQIIFRRAKDRSGFVDWRHMGDLGNGIASLMDDARKELAAPEDRWDLLAVANAVFLKWGKTQMDDDGDTAYIMGDVTAAWDDVVSRIADEKEQKKVLETFMKYCDGSVIDYMEDYLYGFMDSHFKTPELLAIKRQFLEGKIQEVESGDKSDTLKDFYTSVYRDYLLQILADEGVPIDEVEQYAAKYHTYKTDDRLLDIYEFRGEDDREISLLRKLIDKHGRRPIRGYEFTRYENRLKNIYKRTGKTQEYKKLLKKMFYENPGNDELYDEYRKLFTDEEWKQEIDEHLFPVVAGTYNAMSLFEKEKRYDLLMETAEKLEDLSSYEKALKKLYPDRCMNILVKNADSEMDGATERKGYRHVARILKKIKKYPNGAEAAENLAEKYRQEYPRRRALWDELSKV
ncbi:MAG: hypothetical protein LKE44_01180 [Eubacterium sp.]|uniref:hypothetical protein n=1 Tax=Eubacterium sp. F2 TaxID=3381348 RepID=UPI003907FCC5|nr:hypothetical protein [Eubacterium sp.]